MKDKPFILWHMHVRIKYIWHIGKLFKAMEHSTRQKNDAKGEPKVAQPSIKMWQAESENVFVLGMSL